MKILETPIALVIAITSVVLFCLSIFLFLINTNHGNILIAFMYMEVFLLSGNLMFIVVSSTYESIVGQLFSLVLLTVAASESALGLALVIALFQLTGSIRFDDLKKLRG